MRTGRWRSRVRCFLFELLQQNAALGCMQRSLSGAAHVRLIGIDVHTVSLFADHDAARRLVRDHEHRQLVDRFVDGRVELSIAAASA